MIRSIVAVADEVGARVADVAERSVPSIPSAPAVSVVPMPRSVVGRPPTARRRSSFAAETASSIVAPAPNATRSASSAAALATSPALCPPMPSATATRPSVVVDEKPSSLWSRTLPDVGGRADAGSAGVIGSPRRRSRRTARGRRAGASSARWMRSPFTNVPLREPRSSTNRSSPRRNSRACTVDTNWSSGSTTPHRRRARP